MKRRQLRTERKHRARTIGTLERAHKTLCGCERFALRKAQKERDAARRVARSFPESKELTLDAIKTLARYEAVREANKIEQRKRMLRLRDIRASNRA